MPLNWGGGLDSDGEHLDIFLSRGIPETNARRVRNRIRHLFFGGNSV